MPLPLQIISNVIPARWFLVTLKAIMLEGLGIEYFWKETAVLAGMAFVLIALSMKNFKVRL
jgi:ABC-2 type transport system permease protein